MPSVRIWYPPEPSMHGKVLEMPTVQPIQIAKPPVMKAWMNLEADAYNLEMQIQSVMLTIKEWKSMIGPNFYLACYVDPSIPEGAMQPGVPTPMQMMELWPEVIGSICEKFFCPLCQSHQYGYMALEYFSTTCMGCKREFSDQYLELYNHMKNKSGPYLRPSNDYRSKAVAEFEGVGALDDTLWKGFEGFA